jgi:hypothetical protein
MMHLYWHKVSQAIKVAVVGVSLPLLLSSAGLAQQNVQQEAIQVDPRIQRLSDNLMNKNPDDDLDAVQQLMTIIENQEENDDTRLSAAEKLVEKVKLDQKTIDRLIKQLVNFQNKPYFRKWLLPSLGDEISNEQLSLNDEQIKKIISLLDDKDYRIYEKVTYPLREAIKYRKNLENEKIKSELETIANDENKPWKTRIGVAQALGFSGHEVKLSMEVLTKFIKDKNQSDQTQESAVNSLNIVADELSKSVHKIAGNNNLKKDWIDGLELAINQLPQEKESNDNDISQVLHSLKNAKEAINALQYPANPVWIWLTENKKTSILVFLFSFWLFLLFLLLGVKPLSLLWLNSFLQKTDLSLEVLGVNIQTTTLRKLLFDLQYHPRVLDDWVKTNLKTARCQFENKQTVKQRNIYVPTIPVILNGDSIPELTPKDLQYKFSESRETLLIWGEGGSGKTTLACQLAKWAMADDPEQRLCPNHRMLPILIDQELSDEAGNQQQVLMEAIHGQLRDLIEAVKPISEELLEHLLRERRLLVIIDGYSEMRPASRNKIKPELPSFLANALIVTSRSEESLGGVNKTMIKMMRVHSSKLAEFLQVYVNKKGKQDLFKTDQELFQGCIQLSKLVGERDITVLLAKLYADQLIANESNQTTKNLPDNIPDLMLSYLNQINYQLIEKGLENHLDNLTVHQVAKVIAWQCLKQTYRSTTVPLDTLLKVLGEQWGEEPAKTYLKYLENSLNIVETIKPSEDQICFSLDPLAEFLAGLYLVDLYKDNEKLWTEFLAQADAQPGAPEIIKGFLQAVQDCCQKKKDIVPQMVLEALSERILACDTIIDSTPYDK